MEHYRWRRMNLIILASIIGVPEGIIILLLLLPLFLAFKQDAKLRASEPNVKGYKWGYFNAYSFLLCIPLAILALIAFLRDSAALDSLIGCIIFSLYGLCGYFIHKRHKRGWFYGTIISLNPVIWVINYFYAKNRWDELK